MNKYVSEEAAARLREFASDSIPDAHEPTTGGRPGSKPAMGQTVERITGNQSFLRARSPNAR